MDYTAEVVAGRGLLAGHAFGYSFIATMLYFADYSAVFWTVVVSTLRLTIPIRNYLSIDGPPDDELARLIAAAIPLLALPSTLAALHLAGHILSSLTIFSTVASLTTALCVASAWYYWPETIKASVQSLVSVFSDLARAMLTKGMGVGLKFGQIRVVRTGMDAFWGVLLQLLEASPASLTLDLDAYRYDDLKPGHIRLLDLSRRLPFADIRGTLRTVPISDSGPYEAISYCCGDTRKRATLIVNGQGLDIPQSTYNALLAMTCYTRTRVVWIDAVCIRQHAEASNDEKATQIGIMNEIFSGATRVIVWLGYAQDSKAAIDMMTDAMRLLTTRQCGPGDLYAYFADRRHTPAWHALTRLLRNPYFSRTWVMQEVALARKIDVMYGGQYLDWKIFEQVSTMIVSQPEMGILLSTTCNPGWRILKAQSVENMIYMSYLRDRLSTESIPFGELLYSCYRLDAQEKKDKVFALKNMAGDLNGSLLQKNLLPMYQSFEHKIFTHVARHLLGKGEFDPVLPLAGVGWERFLDDGDTPLPSWAADWTGKTVRPMTEMGDSTPFRASGRHWPRRPRFIADPDSPDKTLMVIKGVKIDQIAHVGEHGVPEPPPDKPISMAQVMSTNRKFQEEAWQLAQSAARDPYSTHQSLKEAYWRTLVADRTANRTRPAHPGQETGFDMWVENMYDDALNTYTDLLSRIPSLAPSVPETPFDKVLASLGLFEKIPAWGSNMPEAEFKAISDQLEATSELLDQRPQKYSPRARVPQIQAATAITTAVAGRAFCVTRRGTIGLVPPMTRKDDEVFVLEGAGAPFVMRRLELEGELVEVDGLPCYQLVGECYIHGVMDGEAVQGDVELADLAVV